VFYHNQNAAAVLDSLKGKKLVDVGCGYTPYFSDSMFTACALKGIDFYGIDPIIQHNVVIDHTDAMFSLFSSGQGSFHTKPASSEKALHATADNLPFADGEMDAILSCWLMFIWIDDEQELLKIFTEFYRVLKKGGTVTLYPMPDWSCISITSSSLQSLLRRFSVQQTFVFVPFNAIYPPANQITLTKID
jgi:ubiquinone/menaquinone biosynthesis C-methylase UbiE